MPVLRFRRLQQKLAFYGFVLSAVAMFAVSFVTFHIARTQVQHDRELLIQVWARELRKDIENRLSNVVADVGRWAAIDVVREVLSPPKPNSSAAARFLDTLARNHPEYDVVSIISPAGTIIGTNREAAAYIGRAASQLVPAASLEWLRDVLQAERVHGIPWCKLDTVNQLPNWRISSIPPGLQIPRLYHVVIASPVHDASGDRAIGAVAAVLNWSYIQQVLDAAQEGFKRLGHKTGYPFLLSSDVDLTIGHKDRSLYNTHAVRQLPELQKRARSNPSGLFSYTWRGARKIIALEKIDAAGLGPEFEWRLGVGINESDIFAPLDRLRLWFVVVPIGVSMLVVIFNLVTGKRLEVSLKEFTQLAREAAHGQFSGSVRTETDDELGELAKALNDMLVSFRTQGPFTAILNPYVVGNPVRTNNMFFGRQDDLRWIREQLRRPGNEMILLFGPRRIGKTSLLHQIYREGPAEGVLPFFFDTQQIIPELAHDTDFYHIVTKEILAQLPAVLPGSRAPFIAGDRYGAETLRRLIRFLNDSEPGKAPVLLFDELENLEFKLARGAISADVLLFLSGLLDGDTPVSFVATGSDQLQMLRHQAWNWLIPKTMPRRVGLLAPGEARRLIEEPVRGQVVYIEGTVDRILRITAGHPYYTQAVCQTLVDHLNHQKIRTVTFEVLAEVIELILQNAPLPLSHSWDGLSKDQKMAAAALARRLDTAEEWAATETIAAAMPEELRADTPDTLSFHRALDLLCSEDWLERDDRLRYRFRIDLFRLWVRQEHSVWQVADAFRRAQA